MTYHSSCHTEHDIVAYSVHIRCCSLLYVSTNELIQFAIPFETNISGHEELIAGGRVVRYRCSMTVSAVSHTQYQT